jgi:glycosyltransferase involved in cell wall biosynthesis
MDGVRIYRYWQPWQGRTVPGYLLEYGWAIVWSFAIVCWIWVKEDFDVLHAANPPDLFWLIALPFTLIGKQFVFDQHDLCPELLASRRIKAAHLRGILFYFERCSYKLAKLVIVTNRSAYEIALARGAKKERLCIVRNGPDLDSFVDIEACPALKGGARYMALYVGTIGPQDGVDRIVKAAHHIVHERARRDVRFAILGDGDSVKDLQTLSHALKVEAYVQFCGWLNGTEFLTYLSTADVCLAPEPPEEFNQLSSFIKLTDYMCYSKITISFDLLESRHTLGPAGIFVERDDTALFGDAVLHALDDPIRRHELGRIAGARLRRSFHWGISRKVLLNAYDAVIWNGAALSANDAGLSKDIGDDDRN